MFFYRLDLLLFENIKLGLISCEFDNINGIYILI